LWISLERALTAKDPAFLFYYQDFQHGTRKMTFEEKGAYIELLCEQADCGHLSLEDIKRILNGHTPIWDSICCKFIVDEFGLFYNVGVKVIIGNLQTSGTQGTLTPTIDRTALARSIRVQESVNFTDVKSLLDTYEKSLVTTDTGSIEAEFMYDLDTGNVSPIFHGNRGKFVKLEIAIAESTPVTTTYVGVIQQTSLGTEVDGILTESVTIKLGVAYAASFSA
jgi:hypothetical protein